MDTRKFLELVIEEAQKALDTNNFPCGVVIVDKDGNVIAADYIA